MSEFHIALTNYDGQNDVNKHDIGRVISELGCHSLAEETRISMITFSCFSGAELHDMLGFVDVLFWLRVLYYI